MTKRNPTQGLRGWLASPVTRNSLNLLLFCVPALLFFFVLNYIPMAGIIVAFKKFNVTQGILGSPWAGMQNFRFIFGTTDAWRITRNTLGYNVVFIILNTLISLAIALVLDTLRSRRTVKFFQTVNFFPHFMSWVVTGCMLYAFLQPQYGIFNRAIQFFGGEPLAWYMESKYWIYILPVMYVWKNAGYTSLIYYAGLLGIDHSYYEAAEIDGATDFQLIRTVILPLSAPILAVLTLFYAQGHWNSFFDGFLYLTDSKLFNLQVVLRNFISNIKMMMDTSGLTSSIAEAQDVALFQDVVKYAVIVFTSVPIILVYPFAQKYFIKGVMIGAIKG